MHCGAGRACMPCMSSMLCMACCPPCMACRPCRACRPCMATRRCVACKPCMGSRPCRACMARRACVPFKGCRARMPCAWLGCPAWLPGLAWLAVLAGSAWLALLGLGALQGQGLHVMRGTQVPRIACARSKATFFRVVLQAHLPMPLSLPSPSPFLPLPCPLPHLGAQGRARTVLRRLQRGGGGNNGTAVFCLWRGGAPLNTLERIGTPVPPPLFPHPNSLLALAHQLRVRFSEQGGNVRARDVSCHSSRTTIFWVALQASLPMPLPLPSYFPFLP